MLQIYTIATLLAKVNIGDSAEIESFGDKKFKGIVSQKAFSSNQNAMITDKVTNFIVRIRLNKNTYQEILFLNNKEKYSFRPCMTGSAYITKDKPENVLAVHLASVTLRENEHK